MKRHVVGAHYGMRDWLAQRISAVVIAAYSLTLFALLASAGELSFEAWSAFFAQGWLRVATLVAAVALVWHAWVGTRDILMDYVKPDGLRFFLQVVTVLVLAGYLGWAIEILWG